MEFVTSQQGIDRIKNLNPAVLLLIRTQQEIWMELPENLIGGFMQEGKF